MRLRNVLIVVKDMERSIKFYHDLFGLDTVVDQDGNVILHTALQRIRALDSHIF